jgi:hypothetical protein
MSRTDVTAPIALKEIKERQVDIINELHASGYSYEQLASIFGVKNGAVLRHYVSRDRTPRSDGKILRVIDKQLTNEKSQLSTIIPRDTIDRYTAAHAMQKSSSISYQITSEWPLPSDNLAALSQIFHSAFQISHPDSIENLKRVHGKYYAYRTSTKEGEIVKSYLEINVSEKHASFGHWHPDRYYDPAVKSEVRVLNKAPRRSSGFAVHLANNFFLFGSAENGRAIDFFALRDPMNADFFSISGFNHSTNLDRILFSGRTILVKNNDATDAGIMRMRVSDFNQDSEGFDVRILKTISGYVCDNTTLIR